MLEKRGGQQNPQLTHSDPGRNKPGSKPFLLPLLPAVMKRNMVIFVQKAFEELQAKLESMTTDAFPQARKRMEQFVETFTRTSNQTIDLFEKMLVNRLRRLRNGNRDGP
jgi:hypothetical protein